MDGSPTTFQCFRPASAADRTGESTTAAALEANGSAAGERPAAELPAVLDHRRLDENFRLLSAHYAPQGALENLLVRDLARQLTAAERWAAGAEAVQRQAARGSLAFAADFADDPHSLEDAVLAAALGSEVAHRSERHSLARSRAVERLVERLELVQGRRLAGGAAACPPPAFANEAACEAYLAARLDDGVWRCRKCGGSDGCLLRSRKVRECRDCGTQTGLRFGTVMAGSALPLHTWFAAIGAVLCRPTIGTAELAARLGLSRLGTVRSVARRIREALGTEDAAERLAGLDDFFARRTQDLSQASGACLFENDAHGNRRGLTTDRKSNDQKRLPTRTTAGDRRRNT